MRPTRGFNLEGENETAVVGEAVPAGQVSAAAAEAANQPILGHVRGANNRWIPEQPHGSSELGKEGKPRSRCDSLASWARRCVGRDAEGRLVIGCGGVTLPAMVALHRLVVCALAVGLLWATSLSVARHFTSQFVTAPPLPQVVDACNYAYVEVLRQRSMHSACVTRQVGHCEIELRAAAEAESARSQAEGLYNRDLVVQALTLKQRCGASQLQSLQSLQSLQEVGVVLPWRGQGQCSAGEREQAQAIVGDIGKAKTHAMELAQNYALGAETLQLLALAGLDERAEYDAAYLGQKQAALAAVPATLEELSTAKLQSIKASLRALNASLAVCQDDDEVEQCELPLARQMKDMREQYDLLGDAYDQMKKEVTEYAASVHASVNAVRPTLQSAQELASQLDPGFHIPTLDIPELRLTEVHLQALPSTREMRTEMAAYRRRQQQRAGVYLDQAQSDASSWADEVGLSSAGMDGLLADYDPPPVNTSKQRAAMRRASDKFLAEQEAALDGFAALRRAAANLTGGGGDNASFALPELSAASLVGFSFEPLHGADVDVDLMSLALGKVVWVATAADLTWRAYRSIRLVARYWSKAALAVPPLDLRGDAATRSLTDSLFRACAADPCKLLGRLCFSPATGVALIAMALFLVLNAATALYVPTYLQYVDGCVAPPRNGTFFANNVYSVAYNYAASDGNKALLEGLDAFHSTRAANCSAELRGSAREQQGAQRELESVLEEHEAASGDMRLLRKCLDLNTLGQESSSRGQDALDTFNTLDLMLHSPACEVRLANATLHYAVYNCTALPDCDTTCGGPSHEVTGMLCRRCGCHTEWYFHGMVLQILLAIFVFICINIWRVCLVDALCRLLWRELVAGEFEFVATCDQRGVANVGRAELRDALRAALRWTVTVGWGMLLLSCAINVPWVLVLHYVGAHLNVASLIS